MLFSEKLLLNSEELLRIFDKIRYEYFREKKL